MSNCSNCEYGPGPDPMSDICDGCRNDPDTGLGGFTDHSIGMHFNSDEEAEEYYKNHPHLYEDDDEDY